MCVRKLSLFCCCLVATMFLAFMTSNAQADPVKFNLEWSDFAGGSAAATGTITIDTALVANPGFLFEDPNTSLIFSALSVTVTGSGAGDGIFTGADFNGVIWDPQVPLDLTSQLVGQGGGAFSTFGDFNVFSSGVNPIAPTGFGPNILGTSNNINLTLVSITPKAVPEPSGLLCLVVFGAVVGSRRKRR